MRTPHLQPEFWREALKFINKCPICSAAYIVEHAELFATEDQASLVHLTCEQCHSYFIAMIVAVGHGLSSVGMVTDLSAGDAKRLYRRAPIALNEALEGYELLQNSERFNSLLLPTS